MVQSLHPANSIRTTFFFIGLPERMISPSFQKISGVSTRNFSTWFFIWAKEFFFPKELKSEGAKSGEYIGWGRTSQSSSNHFCQNIKDTADRTLSWWNATPFRFAISELFSIRLIGNKTSLNLSSRCLVKAHITRRILVFCSFFYVIAQKLLKLLQLIIAFCIISVKYLSKKLHWIRTH